MAYARMNAILSAKFFWDKVCHDGFVATKGGYQRHINGVALSPGLPFTAIGAVSQEGDCAHFVSCCVGNTQCTVAIGGRPVAIRGGGLHLQSPFAPVYGQTHAGRLAGSLIALGAKIVSPQFRVTRYDVTRQAIVDHLRPGDVLVYASKDNHDSYEHASLLVGPVHIACHTRARVDKDYTDVYFPWVTLLRLPF